MQKAIELRSILSKINSRGYKAYKEIAGQYDMGSFILYIDHVQSDPFAPPSKIRIAVDQSIAKFPLELFSNTSRKIALEDFIARKFKNYSQLFMNKKGTGSSGLITIDAGAQEIIERTSIKVTKEKVEARIFIGLPAAGRKIISREAENIFFQILPKIVEKSLIYKNLPKAELEHFVYLNEDQDFLRNKLKELGLVCFVGNGSILPRESGISDKPMRDGSPVPFSSPPSLEVQIDLPYSGTIKGMGIPKGITLIVGGGYHGKSTLLKAIEKGVYNHIPSDGREFVITVPDAVKIRAEDGRFIQGTDISPFISNLPGGIDTHNFSTQNASGSTSQAANIIEAVEAGATLLLMDEDTCATNFMIRDGRMQKLVSKSCEPITPFIDRAKELYEKFGVSTILVLGGSGDYLDIAEHVIMLKEYRVFDVTTKAKEIAKEIINFRQQENIEPFKNIKRRKIGPGSIKIGSRDKIKAKGGSHILIGKQVIDLSFVEQLVDSSQTNAIGCFIEYINKKYLFKQDYIVNILNKVFEEIQSKGLEVISRSPQRHPGSLAMPRKYEVMAALNRYRLLKTY